MFATTLTLMHTETIWLESEQIEQARATIDSCASEPAQWQMYLNTLAAIGIERWLPQDGGSNRSIAFHPEGRMLVSGSEDGTIRLWDTITAECLRILTVDRPYEDLNISGVTGLADAQTETLRVLGAIEC